MENSVFKQLLLKKEDGTILTAEVQISIELKAYLQIHGKAEVFYDLPNSEKQWAALLEVDEYGFLTLPYAKDNDNLLREITALASLLANLQAWKYQ